MYVRLIDFSQFENIFNSKHEFDPEIFLLIISTFTEQVLNNESFNKPLEQEFIAKFLLCIATQTPKFDFTLDFLEDKERQKIRYVLDHLD